MTEDTPSLRVPHSNFYFPQEDLLSEWCEKNNTHWTVTRPAFILGANPSSPINISYTLAVYARVQKELGRKLEFPGDTGAWDINKDLSTASLIGYFSEWVVLTPGAANEAFNIVDDSPFSYGKFWPELAKWYGIEYTVPEADDSMYQGSCFSSFLFLSSVPKIDPRLTPPLDSYHTPLLPTTPRFRQTWRGEGRLFARRMGHPS
jgi:hypothetical protein